MGIFYKLEAPVLLEDVDPRSGTYGDYDDFINITTENYAATGKKFISDSDSAFSKSKSNT